MSTNASPRVDEFVLLYFQEFNKQRLSCYIVPCVPQHRSLSRLSIFPLSFST